jgi:hypothetical protein
MFNGEGKNFLIDDCKTRRSHQARNRWAMLVVRFWWGGFLLVNSDVDFCQKKENDLLFLSVVCFSAVRSSAGIVNHGFLAPLSRTTEKGFIGVYAKKKVNFFSI